MTFKVYGPSQSEMESSASKKSGKRTAGTAAAAKPKNETEKQEKEVSDAVVVSPTRVIDSSPKLLSQEPLSNVNVILSSLDCVNSRYFSHFIGRVSSLLLIYDNSTNVNPFRKHFPELARSSPPMVNAMQALGALHLAKTSAGPQRISQFQQAMGNYGEVVRLLREKHQSGQQVRLADLATCLLLCLFEVSCPCHTTAYTH